MENKFNLEVNIGKQILSSEIKIYKTESFFYQTKKIVGIDNFVLKIAESISKIAKDLVGKNDKTNDCFFVKTVDNQFSFLFKLGFQLDKTFGLNECDIIFFEIKSGNDNLKTNDQRINFFIKNSKIFNVKIEKFNQEIDESIFKKLYLISSSEYINFPMLSEKQEKLVEIENENVLVQGVAGSGKTNVCISKIIYTACRNYSGKILYTTFSRGLLIDTKKKIEIFKNTIENLIDDYKNNRIVFLDRNHKKAIENRLGIYIVADKEENIIKKLSQVVKFLDSHIDYKLLEDLYRDIMGNDVEFSDEETFEKVFLTKLNNHQLKNRLTKIKNISYSVIYKEIYGMIFGCYNNGVEHLSLEDYKQKRINSFTKEESEVIYGIAMEYKKFKKAQNLLDNNEISAILLKNLDKFKKYSLSVIDEVQDYTEINLNLLKEISIKMFCVGDALQMINPSYFSFSYLKKLMYNEDVTSVAELECNYRNNKKIVELLDGLSNINIKQFGTHSFVLSGESIDQSTISNTVYTTDKKFIDKLKNEKFENFTILVNDKKAKDELRKIFKKQEILTISEIKGLERETVVLYNILSSNSDKWQRLNYLTINRKQADENSVYRYYFNLFYVGLSRAKHNIFVFETENVSNFAEFFKEHFDILDGVSSFEKFEDVISKLEIDDDEIFERINEFIKLGQFDNAKFYAEKIENDYESYQQIEKINIYKDYIFKNKNKQAGIKLWQIGLLSEAKEQFIVSGETKLIEFMENLENKNQSNLDADIVKFFLDFEDNPDAQNLIIDVVKQDLENIKNNHKNIKAKLKEFKEKK
ncbi:MAG: AAA family ATPase [Clostridia bacterium]|nr:AAA family ATPase [Clostridia bacterium]